MKNLILIIFTLISLTSISQVNKILIIEETNDILYITYTKTDNITYTQFLPRSEFEDELNSLKNALKKDEHIKNNMDLVTRSVYQNTIVSYMGSDRLTLNEPNNNQEYKLFDFETATVMIIAELEQSIRTYLNNL